MKLYKLLVFLLFLVFISNVNSIDISTCDDLQNINNNLTENYVLTDNVSCANENSFTQIGDFNNHFTGNFDGKGFTISDITYSDTTKNFWEFLGMLKMPLFQI